MPRLDARKSGSLKINCDIEIHRLGFGAMRITGPRVWDQRSAALKGPNSDELRIVALGVTGPQVSRRGRGTRRAKPLISS